MVGGTPAEDPCVSVWASHPAPSLSLVCQHIRVLGPPPPKCQGNGHTSGPRHACFPRVSTGRHSWSFERTALFSPREKVRGGESQFLSMLQTAPKKPKQGLPCTKPPVKSLPQRGAQKTGPARRDTSGGGAALCIIGTCFFSFPLLFPF